MAKSGGQRRRGGILAQAGGVAAAVGVLLLTAQASPTPTPSPTPSPSPVGTLLVTKTDAITGARIGGAAFRVYDQDDPSRRTVAQLTGNGDGASLPLGPTYCLEETAVPLGYLNAPTFAPRQCNRLDQKQALTVAVTDPPGGTLQVVKTDPSGQPVRVPGFTFNLHAGSASGPVVAGTTTDTSGNAIAAALSPATYCLEETDAPDGYQVAPTYSPGACVPVAADPTRGQNPTTVTVSDPPSASSASAVQGQTPNATSRRGPTHLDGRGQASAAPGFRPGSPAFALTTFGAILLVAGLAMMAAGIHRRRLAGLEPPSGSTFDMTIG